MNIQIEMGGLMVTEHDNFDIFRRDWLNLTVEEVIDPELPICDAHHHLWNLQGQRYLAADFTEDASVGHNIVQSVVIQSRVNRQEGPGGGMTPVQETQFVMKEVSAIGSSIDVGAGFIAFADLTLGNAVAPILESHVATAGNRLRGIRFTKLPVPGESISASTVLSQPSFQDGLAQLHNYSLTYELMVIPAMFAELANLANRFPETPIIVDHIGWAGDQRQSEKRREETIREWKTGILKLVPCSNVYVKLGGLGMSIFGFGWNRRATPPGSIELASAMAPYYLYCIEHFGVKRCMFESNFPVDKESYSYTVLWNALKRITSDFSHTERCALFQGTAAQVYGL
jgi:L-fuconolactonase